MTAIRVLDYITYGRDLAFFGSIAGQTIPVFLSLLVGSVPVLVLPLSGKIQASLFALTSIGLAILLAYTVRWISQKTYSIKLQRRRALLTSVCAYLSMGGGVVTVGYFLFVFPYPHPSFDISDILLGLTYSIVYAELAAIGLATNILSERRSPEISTTIEEFLEKVEEVQTSERLSEDYSGQIVEMGQTISSAVKNEPASGTNDVGTRLDDWVECFDKERDYRGRQERIESDEFSKIADDLCELR